MRQQPIQGFQIGYIPRPVFKDTPRRLLFWKMIFSKKELHKKLAAETKREITVTRAFVLFGFDSWLALEPGKQI